MKIYFCRKINILPKIADFPKAVEKNLGFLYVYYIAKKRGFPPVYKIEGVAKMSAKRAFFSVFQKFMVVCCAIFFGIANAFSATLPAGYTELEYIESTGTQYINTGRQLSGSDTVELKFSHFTPNAGDNMPFGAYNGERSFALNIMNSGSYYGLYFYYASPVGALLSTLTNYDDAHTVKIEDRKVYVDGALKVSFDRSSDFTTGNNVMLFSSGNWLSKVRIYYYRLNSSANTPIQSFVPARRDSDGEIGMYDVMDSNPSTAFHTNRGTGTFTAGPVVLNPCRNLFDKNANNVENGFIRSYYISNNDSPQTFSQSNVSEYIPVNENTSYYLTSRSIVGAASMCWYSSDKTLINCTASFTGRKTSPNNAKYVRISYWIADADIVQFEAGSTATDYVPYCSAEIKIATTAYNTARFSPVVTDLNSAVATIREIVTKTINQTAAIASLQADKQTRPEDACPAGKKCLLVETEENGVVVPHWFPIIETPEE